MKVPKDTVLIHSLGRALSAPATTPFLLKLETFCRMMRIPYMVSYLKHTSRTCRILTNRIRSTMAFFISLIVQMAKE